MNDREAFEKWYWDKWEGCPVFVANTKERTFRKYKDSLKYFNNQVQRSCDGWQAAIAHKQGEANPVACMFINYDGECEEIGHLDNYNGQVPDEFTPLFTYQPDQSTEIARLNKFISNAFLAHPNLDLDIEAVLKENT